MNIIDKVVISNDMPSYDNIWIHLSDDNYIAQFYTPYGWKTISSSKNMHNEEADSFEDFNNTTQYHTDDIVRRNGALYKFIANHIGQWDESKVTKTSVYDELDNNKVSLNEARDITFGGVVEFNGERVEIDSDLHTNLLLYIDPEKTMFPDTEKWLNFSTLESCITHASIEDINSLFII